MRYKEYNANRVLEQAIKLFWDKGFNGCSINEIVENTGVNRFSLYHEFENKEGILYQSLLLYRERHCTEKLSMLESTNDLRTVLSRFYDSFFNNKEPVVGCYLIHIGTELADTDDRVKELVDIYLEEIHTLITDLLITHEYEKSDADYLSRHLVALYCTVMSFCLVQNQKEREEYIANGINIILYNYATSIK